MPNLNAAVQEYFRRETEANRRPKGADHKAILRQVADQNSIAYETLKEAVIDASFAGVN